MLARMGNTQKANPAFVALMVVGGVALLAGAITWIFGVQNLAYQSRVAEYATAMSGMSLGQDGVAQAQLVVIAGIVLTVLGGVLLIAGWIIAAARRVPSTA